MSLTDKQIAAGKVALQLYRDNLHAAFRTAPRPEQTQALCEYAVWLEGEVRRLESECAELEEELADVCQPVTNEGLERYTIG